PTYRATGKGYFGQQQVVDLLAYLRLLHNRYDDAALLAVLASPFVGVSNDGLALIRRSASRRPLFTGVEHSLPPALDTRDTGLLRAFRQRFDRLVDAMSRLSLERLCEQVVSEHDYDLAVLAQWDGRRRYANMRKLMRLARSYEELRGPDVEGFVRFVREQEAVGARELEAVAEEEGADAVRLLTIHAAKGLEFKVVIVADAGRDRVPPSPDEILALPDGRFGFRVADPVTAKRRGAFDYEAVKEARQEAERAERLGLYYVAMTRAKERLIVSGSVDLGSEREVPTPIAWVLDRLDADDELAQAEDAPIELVRGDARLLVRLDRHRPEPATAEPEPEEEGQLALFAAVDEIAAPLAAPELPPLVALPKPPLYRVRKLSFTALSLFEQCGVLVHGYLDAFHLADGRALVVDYKTNLLGEVSPEEIVDQDYRLQRLVYALACFRAGAEEVEIVYHFLERPDAPVEVAFSRADILELEAELSAAIARIQTGEFPPTPTDFACPGCPALDLVCAGPRLRPRLPEVVAS